MKKQRLFLVLSMLTGGIFPLNAAFEEYFEEATLRIDFFLAGNRLEQRATFDKAFRYPGWAGTHSQLIPAFDFGDYCFRISTQEDDSTLFIKGFCTLFQEWRTTPEALMTERIAMQTQNLPFPSRPVFIELKERMPDNRGWRLLFRHAFDPSDLSVVREPPPNADVTQIHKGGAPASSVDLTIVAEGYTQKDRKKFLQDALCLSEQLFKTSPFAEIRDHWNIRAVFIPSEDRGPDIPQKNLWRRTPLGSSFYTFGIDRYLTVPRTSLVWDWIGGIPTDAIYVLVNTPEYGGGGIYNEIAVGSSDHPLSFSIFLHELGHGFAGLGDEYYESSVTYEGYYSQETEPWEPNLTTRVDFESKWPDMIPEGVPIPTPAGDTLYSQFVGLFEGGGYVSRGIFRPFDQCRMRSNQAEFCPVCSRAIRRMTAYYCD